MILWLILTKTKSNCLMISALKFRRVIHRQEMTSEIVGCRIVHRTITTKKTWSEICAGKSASWFSKWPGTFNQNGCFILEIWYIEKKELILWNIIGVFSVSISGQENVRFDWKFHKILSIMKSTYDKYVYQIKLAFVSFFCV